MMTYKINKDKEIGDVLFIVEGSKTEFYILRRIFSKLFGYNYEEKKRDGEAGKFKYHKFTGRKGSHSRVFVLNSYESNIKFIDYKDEYFNNLLISLNEDYRFPVKRADIYYLFDRDPASNIDPALISELLNCLGDARYNEEMLQGILLLSYPSIEAFVSHNLLPTEEVVALKQSLGKDLKRYNHERKINHQNISDDTLLSATAQMQHIIEDITDEKFDIDEMKTVNRKIFDYQEQHYDNNRLYRVLSLLSVALIDLGLLEPEGT